MLGIANVLDRFVTWIGLAGATLILPLTIVTSWEVIVRHMFDRPTTWSFEMGYMLTGSYFLLSGGYALKEGSHIRIDVFYAKLSSRTQAWIDVLFMALVLLPLLTLLSDALWTYATDALHSGRTTGKSSWNPPAWPFRMIMFIGVAALTLQVISFILRKVSFLLNGQALGTR